MIKKINSFFIFQLILFTAFANSDSTKIELKVIQPEEQHSQVFQTALQFVSAYHLNNLALNDSFSSKAFENYLNHIDPSHVYFLQADIDAFQKYRYKIDDDVFTGNVTPGFDIFNVFRDRLKDRIDYTLSLLKDSFDFNENDSFLTDRENAPWPKDFRESDRVWKQKLKYECLSIAAGGKDYKSYSETIRKRYENLLKISAKTKSEDIFQLYMNALLEIADPHTNYFSPRSAEDFTQSMSLSLEGIGAQLRTDNEYTLVNEIIKGGPADKSKKLHAGDKIIGVSQHKDSDMVHVIDWRIDDVVALIRGKKGTLVRLEIIPKDDPNKTRVIELIRDKIVLEDQAAKSSVKELTRNGKKIKVGVVTIPAFYINFAAQQQGDPNFKSTTRDVKKLIRELQKEDIQGLMIDLRNNGGGSLQEAVDLTGLFIKEGPVVQVKDKNSTRVESDEDPEVFYDGPLVVLVNRFSASASEIFAAAVQDYKRGVIIGERTYGKGTVQNVADLNNFIHIDKKKVGQVKLTIAKFYRINGSSTQHKGVIPDIILPGFYDDAKYGEDGNPNALPWDEISSANYKPVNIPSVNKTTLNIEHDARMKTNPEYKYLLEDLANLKNLEDKKYQTLNLKKHKEESEAQEKSKKEREEARKKVGQSNYDLTLQEGEESIADMLAIKKGVAGTGGNNER